MVHSGVIYKFLADGGPPNVAGSGVATPLPYPLDGPVAALRVPIVTTVHDSKQVSK